MPKIHEIEKVEEWKDVVGFEGSYQVSNLGRVKSVHRKVKVGKGWQSVRERILKSQTLPKGYKQLILRKDGKHHAKYPHRLVLEAFIGPNPVGMECCHDDGNPANNRLDNLRWDTPESNNADKLRHGTVNHEPCVKGEEVHTAVQTEHQVIALRQEWATGKYKIAQLARTFGS